MDRINEHTALVHLRHARECLLLAKQQGPTREGSLALTECEASILWLKYDIELKYAGEAVAP